MNYYIGLNHLTQSRKLISIETVVNLFEIQVADYSDTKILQIKTSPKQYPAKLAEAYIAEANFRKLDLLDNSQNLKRD